MSTVFDGITRSYIITRAAVAGGGTDPFGNTIPATPEVSFRASLHNLTSGALVERYGADNVDMVLIGEMLDPTHLPAGVTLGFEAPLDWNGEPGTIRVVSVTHDPLEFLESLTGQVFHATWRRA
jgi:hypothetical protein